MSIQQLRQWCEQQLDEWGEPSLEASPDYANAVASLKLKLCDAGHPELSLSLPVEPTKRKVSAVAQFQRILSALQQQPADVPTNTDWLTARQAATLANLGERTIYRLCEQGELQTCRTGRSIRIKRSDLMDYLEGLESLPD